MVNNPYAPPSAAISLVEVLELPRVRPAEVRRAVQLLWFSYGLGLLSVAWSWSYYTAKQSMALIILQRAFGLVIAIWLYGKLYQGRNWARVLILVTTILGMLSILTPPVWKTLATLPVFSWIVMLINYIIYSYALWLFFSSPGNEWFRKRSKSSGA